MWFTNMIHVESLLLHDAFVVPRAYTWGRREDGLPINES